MLKERFLAGYPFDYFLGILEDGTIKLKPFLQSRRKGSPVVQTTHLIMAFEEKHICPHPILPFPSQDFPALFLFLSH